MKQNSTLKKLSEILNISISTVSRALKDHPDISAETKRRVNELAQTLEYEPNSYAVQLRTNESNVLGVLVPVINNFFYDSYIAAVEEMARPLGYSVLIMQSGDDRNIEHENLRLFKKQRVTGLFVALTTGTTQSDIDSFLKLKELSIPVIFFDLVPEFAHCNKVCLDDESAARLAAEAIIKKNKKNILALFGNTNLSITKRRSETFKKVFDQLSPKTNIDFQYVVSSQHAKEVVEQKLKSKKKPDTIFCMGDLILIGTMEAIHESNLKIPEDIGVISISNGFIPTLYKPKITYVETSGYKLGKAAFSRMLSCLQNRESIEEICIESVLVKGNSL